MRIITLTCPDCGTVVAANELERRRVLKCPGYSCKEVLRFEDLTAEEQEFYLEHREDYQI
jgi:phage FluMu protein Com